VTGEQSLLPPISLRHVCFISNATFSPRYMSVDEVRAWIIPPDFDHTEAEARHLMEESDTDHDEKLTKQEILENYDLFVGSQATDFGEALTRHDEF